MSIYNSNTSKSNNNNNSNNNIKNANTDIIKVKDVIDETAGNNDKQRLDSSASKPTSRFNMQDYEFKDVLGT
jgi:hypothetical protein